LMGAGISLAMCSATALMELSKFKIWVQK
jgi:hypothetical protein